MAHISQLPGVRIRYVNSDIMLPLTFEACVPNLHLFIAPFSDPREDGTYSVHVTNCLNLLQTQVSGISQ